MVLKQDEVTRGALEDYIMRRFIVCSPCQILPVYYAWWQSNSDNFFYVLLTVYSRIIFFKWSQLGAHYFLVYLFQLLYVYRATMCPSSGELLLSMQHWYFSLLMGGCLVCRPDSYPYRVKNTVPVSHRYSKFSWWWTHSFPKHVEMLK